MNPSDIALIGVPTDVGAATRGASMGPEALRVAGLVRALQALGRTVIDTGNLSGPSNPEQPPCEGIRHLAEGIAWNQTLHDAMLAQLQAARLPIVLGGDHSLGIGSVSAVVRHCRDRGRKLRVLWLDAHADLNTAGLTPTGNLHGMPLACLFGHGPIELTGISGKIPALRADQLRQVGQRSVDDGEKRFLRDLGVRVYDMRYIDENGMRAAMAAALDDIDADTHLHVSLDVDFLDPADAPGVGTTVRGGPTYREAQLCMELIADTGAMASLDLVELNPALDRRNATAELVVDLVLSLFGKSTLVR
ncbi:MAG: arginase [Burkholderiaceae bacterium]